MDSFKDDVLFADAAEDIAMYQDTVGDLFSIAMNAEKLPGDKTGYEYLVEKYKAV